MPVKPKYVLAQELKKCAIRQNWSPVTLFNLSRLRRLSIHGSFFQQKWRAKQEARRYHGEHLTLRQWQNIFRHSLTSSAVTPMNARQMAVSDGSDNSLGRGSGLMDERIESKEEKLRRNARRVPYAHMMWAPLERRLDMAVFRALFASSVRQARQFVLHGWVHVNGKKMIHPNYMLNPGDMFSVDPEKVLLATGAAKNAAKKLGVKPEAPKIVDPDLAAVQATIAAKAESDSSNIDPETSTAPIGSPENPDGIDVSATSTAEILPEPAAAPVSAPTSTGPYNPYAGPENPQDDSKPYLTPWRPKDLMAPFAFIPRYLEVNHNICHAVYLRHPVAGPGYSEIPSPFSSETQSLAYNWFLRRR